LSHIPQIYETHHIGGMMVNVSSSHGRV